MSKIDSISIFEKFAGLDYRSTSPSRPDTAAKNLQNMMPTSGYGIKGRFGHNALGFEKTGFISSGVYSYFDEESGENVQEILAIGESLWRLRLGYIHLYGDSTHAHKIDSFTWALEYIEPHGRKLTITSTVGGVPHGSLPSYVLEGPQGIVGKLVDFVNANNGELHVKATIRVPERQNGTLTLVEHPTLKVDDVYTAFEIDLKYQNGGSFRHRPLVSYDRDGKRLVYHQILTTPGGGVGPNIYRVSLDLSSGYDYPALAFGDYVGVSGADIQGITPCSGYVPCNNGVGDGYIPFYFWEPVASHNYTHLSYNRMFARVPFGSHKETIRHRDYQPAQFLNASQSCYIFTALPGKSENKVLSWEGYPLKYDGVNVYRAGVPGMNQPVPTSLTGASPMNGAYRYAIRYAIRDARGIVSVGNDNTVYGIEITANPVNQRVALTLPNLPFCCPIGATVDGNQSGTTVVNVLSGHTISAGDSILYAQNSGTHIFWAYARVLSVSTTSLTLDNAASSGGDFLDASPIFQNPNYYYNFGLILADGAQNDVRTIKIKKPHTSLSNNFFGFYPKVGEYVSFFDEKTRRTVHRKLTAVSYWDETNRTITFGTDEDTVSVIDSRNITNGHTFEIYRTKANGNVFYLVENAAPSSLGGVPGRYVYIDDKGDDDLTIEMARPDIDYEFDLPPRASIGALHQGVMVYSGIMGSPNQVAYSLPTGPYTGPDAVPLASQYFEVPSNVDGPISAIVSDADSALAIFKPSAYYEVSGDLPSGAIQVVTKQEGDYGIASQSSVAKIKGWIVGVGALGVIRIRNGVLDHEFSDAINVKIANNPKIALRAAIGANDPTTQAYRLYIPGRASPAEKVASDYRVAFGYDNAIHLLASYRDDNFDIVGGRSRWPWFNNSSGPANAPSGGMFAVDMPLEVNFTGYTFTPDQIGNVRCFVSLNASIDYPSNAIQTVNSPGVLLLDSSVLPTLAPNLVQICCYDIRTKIDWIVDLADIHLGDLRTKKLFRELVIYSFYAEREALDYINWVAKVTTYPNFRDSKNNLNAHTQVEKLFSGKENWFHSVSLKQSDMAAIGIKLECSSDASSKGGFTSPPQLSGLELFFVNPNKKESSTD